MCVSGFAPRDNFGSGFYFNFSVGDGNELGGRERERDSSTLAERNRELFFQTTKNGATHQMMKSGFFRQCGGQS